MNFCVPTFLRDLIVQSLFNDQIFVVRAVYRKSASCLKKKGLRFFTQCECQMEPCSLRPN